MRVWKSLYGEHRDVRWAHLLRRDDESLSGSHYEGPHHSESSVPSNGGNTGLEQQPVGPVSPKSGTPILTPRQPKPLLSFNYHHINTDRVSGGCIHPAHAPKSTPDTQTTPTQFRPSPQAPVWRLKEPLNIAFSPLEKRTVLSVYFGK